MAHIQDLLSQPVSKTCKDFKEKGTVLFVAYLDRFLASWLQTFMFIWIDQKSLICALTTNGPDQSQHLLILRNPFKPRAEEAQAGKATAHLL